MKIEILTPNGWSDFHGIKRSKAKKYVKIQTETASLECTLDHKLKTITGYTEAKTLKPGQKIQTAAGYKKIASIYLIESPVYVYDILEVSKNNEYYTNNILSHNCSFQGSSNTLISGSAISSMVFKAPLLEKDSLKIFDLPEADRQYVLTVDCSEGVGSDYSTINVIDVTEYPFKQVAVYRNNLVSPLLFPDIIAAIGKEYNFAWVLIEINSAGKQVADLLRFDLEYENVFLSSTNEKKRQQLMSGSGNEMIPGVRTTKSTKKIGCSNIKHLIENGKFIVQDYVTIEEISRFTKKGDSFEAEEGHDDMIMGLVIFGWLTGQEFFKELLNKDTREELFKRVAETFSFELPMDIFGTQAAVKANQIIDKQGIVWTSA